jgi:F-type H+/Na+-transporting ATPase subunit alpha
VPVEQQVAIIYAVTNGHLDDVKVEHIRQWEREFLDYLEAKQPEILGGIRTKKALDDDLTGKLKAAITAFKPLFTAD